MNDKEQSNLNNEKIKACIKGKGYKLMDVAEALGISKSNLTNTLNGDMSLSRAQKIADFLGCSLDELLGGDSNHSDIVCPHCGKPINVTLS